MGQTSLLGNTYSNLQALSTISLFCIDLLYRLREIEYLSSRFFVKCHAIDCYSKSHTFLLDMTEQWRKKFGSNTSNEAKGLILHHQSHIDSVRKVSPVLMQTVAVNVKGLEACLLIWHLTRPMETVSPSKTHSTTVLANILR